MVEATVKTTVGTSGCSRVGGDCAGKKQNRMGVGWRQMLSTIFRQERDQQTFVLCWASIGNRPRPEVDASRSHAVYTCMHRSVGECGAVSKDRERGTALCRLCACGVCGETDPTRLPRNRFFLDHAALHGFPTEAFGWDRPLCLVQEHDDWRRSGHLSWCLPAIGR